VSPPHTLTGYPRGVFLPPQGAPGCQGLWPLSENENWASATAYFEICMDRIRRSPNSLEPGNAGSLPDGQLRIVIQRQTLCAHDVQGNLEAPMITGLLLAERPMSRRRAREAIGSGLAFRGPVDARCERLGQQRLPGSRRLGGEYALA